MGGIPVRLKIVFYNSTNYKTINEEKMKDLLDLLFSKECKLLMKAVLKCTPPVENVEHLNLNSQRT